MASHQSRNHIDQVLRTYSDLKAEDIEKLAAVLGPTQPAEDYASPEWKDERRRLTALLPNYTRISGLGRIVSSFCSLHSRLNPLPIASMFEALKFEIEVELAATWIPLVEKETSSRAHTEMIRRVQDLHVVWLGNADFQRQFSRKPFMDVAKRSKCAACRLAQLSSDFKALIGLAACMRGRMRVEVYKRSKRLKWVTACLAMFAKRSEVWDRTALLVGKLGDELRQIRKENVYQSRDSRRHHRHAMRPECRSGVVQADVKQQAMPDFELLGLHHQPNNPFDRSRAVHRARSVFRRAGSSNYSDERLPTDMRRDSAPSSEVADLQGEAALPREEVQR